MWPGYNISTLYIIDNNTFILSIEQATMMKNEREQQDQVKKNMIQEYAEGEMDSETNIQRL